MPPRTKRTKAREARFLDALARGVSVAAAAAEAGFTHSCAYKWRDADPEFAARWRDAYEAGTDKLEDEARRRAVDGVETPVYYGGKKVGDIKKYSDPLLMFLLRGRRPGLYRDRAAADPAQAGGGPLGISYDGLSELDFDQRLVAIALRLAEIDPGAQFAGRDRALVAPCGPGEPGDADTPGAGPGKPGG